MTLRWRAGLIFSILSGFLTWTGVSGETIYGVTYSGNISLGLGHLQENSLIGRGRIYSDSLIRKEISRLDSLYFYHGILDWGITVDTVRVEKGLQVNFEIDEGERASVGQVKVNVSSPLNRVEITDMLDVQQGDPFDPPAIGSAMKRVLFSLNNNGYPYAQVWITGYTYEKGLNEVLLAFSVSPGRRAKISSVLFEGITRTDTSTALAFSRLKKGSFYSESSVERAGDYLRSSGYFQSVGQIRLEKGSDDGVDVIIPLKEKKRSSMFQGAFGFSRKDDGDYLLNGSVDVGLRNIAGTGRNVELGWLNDGRGYSRLEVDVFEPFLAGLPLHLTGKLKQIVQDSIYTMHSGGLYLNLPVNPDFTVYFGAAVDRNISDTGELLRSIRQRYRTGLSIKNGQILMVDTHLEGAYKNRYLTGSRVDRNWQLIYRFETNLWYNFFRNQGCSCHFVSEGLFSSGEVHTAELFPLGGAGTLRGYRENQFRGEKISYVNLEYRFGTGDRVFLFDDVAGYCRGDRRWELKNGFGFGVRSVSAAGTIVLSFGVGERISLKGTHIHIQLIENF